MSDRPIPGPPPRPLPHLRSHSIAPSSSVVDERTSQSSATISTVDTKDRGQSRDPVSPDRVVVQTRLIAWFILRLHSSMLTAMSAATPVQQGSFQKKAILAQISECRDGRRERGIRRARVDTSVENPDPNSRALRRCSATRRSRGCARRTVFSTVRSGSWEYVVRSHAARGG